jgi:hypothetical protein
MGDNKDSARFLASREKARAEKKLSESADAPETVAAPVVKPKRSTGRSTKKK